MASLATKASKGTLVPRVVKVSKVSKASRVTTAPTELMAMAGPAVLILLEQVLLPLVLTMV